MSYYNEPNDNYERKPRGRKSKKKQSDFFFSDFIANGSCDSFLFILVIGLAIIGLIMILSSSYYKSIQTFGHGFFYFSKQLKIFILSLILMIIASKINYNVYKKLAAPIIYYGSLALLVFVLFKGIIYKGANRWIEIFGYNFQPSELAKLGLIMFMSVILSRRKDNTEELRKIKKSWDRFKFIINSYSREIIMVLVPTILIGIENWSTAIIILATGFIMMAVSGLKLHKVLLALGILVLIVIGAIKLGAVEKIQELNLFEGKYNSRLGRLEAWLDPFSDPLDTGYQTVQSLYAIGSGGITGVGLGKSKQKLGYLPESYNDMIFTIVCEEFGLVGAIVILCLFIILIVQCIKIAMNAPDKFSLYFVTGMITYIALQVIVNVGVVTGVLPNTGMPLPFISYGGTALLVTMLGMGIVLSITRYED